MIFNKDFPWLYLDQESGKFCWVGKSSKYSKVKPGDLASKMGSNGYNYVYANGKLVRAARLVWYFNTGRWPEHQVDHIDGYRSNDRFHNLRDVESSTNNRNRRLPTTNLSGHIGVCNTDCGFQSYIYRDNKKVHLGTYRCVTAAALARKLAEIKYGFHKNHGRNRKVDNDIPF